MGLTCAATKRGQRPHSWSRDTPEVTKAPCTGAFKDHKATANQRQHERYTVAAKSNLEVIVGWALGLELDLVPDMLRHDLRHAFVVPVWKPARFELRRTK